MAQAAHGATIGWAFRSGSAGSTFANKVPSSNHERGAAAGIVVGGRPVRPDDLELRWVGGALYRNTQIEETGVAIGVLGHPVGGDLADRQLSRFDTVLEPGHVVLAGSFVRPIHCHPGDTIRADFGELGSVSLQFD